MGLFKETMTASEGIATNMKEYGDYSIKSKFPNVIDGLKPVHRRILLALHKHPDFQKEATLVGRVMEMHPHGDASIAKATSIMAQPFSNIVPTVYSESNVGTYVGNDPAAARYVDVCEAEVSVDLFFKNTDTTCLKMVPCESEKGVEPANFVPVIPTAMLFPAIGIAVGFKTETSAVSVESLCHAAKKFIELKYHDPDWRNKVKAAIAPMLLPDFPSFCILRNSDQIVSEYRKGNYDCPIVVDGKMSVTRDTIIINTISPTPGNSFKETVDKCGLKTALEKGSWFHEHFQLINNYSGKDEGSVMGKCKCILRRGENPFEVLGLLKKYMSFTSSWVPPNLYCDEEAKLSMETPLTLLDKWSDARYKVVLGGLKQKLITLSERYRKLLALVIVVDHAKEVSDIFCSSKDEDATVHILVKRFGLTAYQAKFLQSLPLKKLTAKGRDELIQEIEEVKQQNRELQKRFSKVDEEITDAITAFENKYAKQYPAKCVVPSFIGTACYKGTGWILMESLEEMDKLISDFNIDDLKFDLFQSRGKVVTLGSDDPMKLQFVDVPKYSHASYVGQVPFTPKRVAFMTNGGTAVAPVPVSSGLLQEGVIPVKDKFTVITKNNGRLIVPVDEKVMKKSMNAAPAIKDVLYISPLEDEEIIVVHGNTKIPNEIHLDRIRGNGKISRVVVGQTIVVGVYRPGQPVVMTFPEELRPRSGIRHMYVKDLGKIVTEAGKTEIIYLNKKKTSTGLSVTQFKSRSQIFAINV